MKKILILTILTVGLLAFAGMAAADDVVAGSGTVGGSTGSSLDVTTSSNVQITYDGVDQAYGAMGEHKAGNRVYCTGSSTPGIFYKTKEAGSYTTETVDSTFTGSGWTAQ